MQHRLPLFLLIGVLFCIGRSQAQGSEGVQKAIREIMHAQEIAWNEGNLEGFMEGYWHSDSLRFIGSRGLTYGWEATLSNYKKGYPDRKAMGMLQFKLISIEKLSARSAFVIGQWHLKREAGDLSGHFTLLWKKIKGHWVIVADHSS